MSDTTEQDLRDDDVVETAEAEGVEQQETGTELSEEQAAELDERLRAELSEEELAELEDDDEAPTRGRRRLRLSAHFLLAEFHCKDGTRVPAASVPAVRRLVREQLEPMREKFGAATVNSAYRTERHNRRIGGERRSFHVYDFRPANAAADLTFSRGTPTQWAAEARRLLGSGRGGVGTYVSARFVHVDNRARVSSWQG